MPLATAETDRLTNMAAAVGAGVALVPIPCTTAALSGIELLLIGAIARIWGVALTPAFTEGLVSWMVARLGVSLGMHVVGDLIGMVPGLGTIAKTAIAAGAIKFIGSSMNYRFSHQYGEKRRAHASADAAKADLDQAVKRLGANSGKLAEGAKQAFSGDGALLAATLNEIFGLNKPSEKPQERQESKKQKRPEKAKRAEEPKPAPRPLPAEIDPDLEFVLRPADAVDFQQTWDNFQHRWKPLLAEWDEDEWRLFVQTISTNGKLFHVLVDGELAGWLEYNSTQGKAMVGHMCLEPMFAAHVLKRLSKEADADDKSLQVNVGANFYDLLTPLSGAGFQVRSDDLKATLQLSHPG